MKIPSEHSFKALAKRKDYLALKLQTQAEGKSGYILQEIDALERLINFSKLIITSFPNDQIKKIIDEHELENAEAEKPADGDGDGPETIYTYPVEMSKNYRLSVLFTKQEKESYIHLEIKKYEKNRYRWETRGKFQFPAQILEDILHKFHAVTQTPAPC